MKVRMFVLITILIVIGILIDGCAQKPKIEKPTVTIDDISVKSVTTQTLNLDVRVIVSNPNPVGANLKKIVFDMYYLVWYPEIISLLKQPPP